MKEPTDKTCDVFLSYNKNDESWAARLKSALDERDFKVWLACDDILAGEPFPKAIEDGLKTSAAVAFVVSPGEHVVRVGEERV